jgi:hypothetical protein
MRKITSLALTCFLISGSAAGLALMHDIEESKYIEFGKTFPAVAQVGGLASGTLIAPDWILTVAHAPEMIQKMKPGKPILVKFGKREYEVARVVIPEARKLAPEQHDIALLQLKEKVSEKITPLALWKEDVEPETPFALAGWGILAMGDEGIRVTREAMSAPTRRRRAGWNVMERLDADKDLLIARFDDPDTALELEAGPCIGDSGGPAMIRVQGEEGAPDTWHVAGVIANVDDADNDGVIGEYGDEFGMTIVASYVDWIEATLGE